MRALRFYSAVAPFRSRIGLSTLLFGVEETFSLISPYFMGLALSAAIAGNQEAVMRLLGGLFVAEMIARSTGWRRSHIDTALHYRLTTHLSVATLKKLTALSVGQFKSLNSAQIQRIARDGESATWNIIRTSLFDVTPIILRIIGATIALALFDIRLSAIFGGTVALSLTIMFIANKKYGPEVKKEQEKDNALNKEHTETIRHMPLLLLGARARQFTDTFAASRAELDQWGIALWRRFMGLSEIRTYLITIASFATLAFAFSLAAEGTLEIGMIVTVIGWTRNGSNNLSELQRSQRNLVIWWAQAERYFKLLDTPPAIIPAKNPLTPKKFAGTIEFKNIAFEYPAYGKIEDEERGERPRRALYGMSLIIPAGKRVAFVGPSGAGKTTIANLILRAYDPTRGTILVDGIPLPQIDLDCWRESVGYVEQDVVLFDQSIRHNVGLGRNVPDKTMRTVAKLSRLEELKSRLTHGWDTIVGERGIRLSGGERQRVGIARALAKNPSVLILDEATASLDTKNERLIHEAIENASAGRTTVIIAHRLSTVISADTIFVIEKGRIAAHGTHRELLISSPLYQELVQNQLVGPALDSLAENQETPNSK